MGFGPVYNVIDSEGNIYPLGPPGSGLPTLADAEQFKAKREYEDSHTGVKAPNGQPQTYTIVQRLNGLAMAKETP